MTDVGIIDLDNHFYEPADALTRHLEPEFREVLNDLDIPLSGGATLTNWAPGREGEVFPPGSLKKIRLAEANSREAMLEYLVPAHPGFSNREARLALMDEQGVEACVMFSSAVSIEHKFPDPAALYAHFRALNRWIEDEWGYAYQGRIFSPPMISLRDLDMAVAELDRVLALGARVINMRPGHAYGRSPSDPYFDPFWARVNEAKVAVTFHQGESGWNERIAPDWGQNADPAATQQSAWQWMNTYGNVPIMAVLSALLYDNLFGRFPNIRVASVENGAMWLPYFLYYVDKNRGIGRNGPWIGGPLSERPSAIARQHILVAPYPEEDLQPIVDQIGWELLAMGSDFPHMEGCENPGDFRQNVAGLPEEAQRWILHDNPARFLGLD